MDTRIYYSQDEAIRIANYLCQLDNQDAPIDYEVRIDDRVAVPRTNDPGKFQEYMYFLTEDSREMTVLFYKGNSRVSDKTVLVISDKPAAAPVPTLEQRVEAALAQERADVLRKYEMDTLKRIRDEQREKIRKLKRKVKKLKAAVAAAGSESAGLAKVLKDLAASPKVKGLFNVQGEGNGSGAADLGALPDEMIVGYLKEYRETLGEQTFQELLGTTLTMAQQPELIAKVRAFITDQNNAA